MPYNHSSLTAPLMIAFHWLRLTSPRSAYGLTDSPRSCADPCRYRVALSATAGDQPGQATDAVIGLLPRTGQVLGSDGECVGEPAQHRDVGQRREAALLAGDLGGGVASAVAELSERQPLGGTVCSGRRRPCQTLPCAALHEPRTSRDPGRAMKRGDLMTVTDLPLPSLAGGGAPGYVSLTSVTAERSACSSTMTLPTA
jgi:hypothetical protein